LSCVWLYLYMVHIYNSIQHKEDVLPESSEGLKSLLTIKINKYVTSVNSRRYKAKANLSLCLSITPLKHMGRMLRQHYVWGKNIQYTLQHAWQRNTSVAGISAILSYQSFIYSPTAALVSCLKKTILNLEVVHPRCVWSIN